jgi:hypothetical protein
MFTSSPYPGLRAFQEDEKEIFFGRDKEIEALLDRLAQSPFTAVVGPSGCGKSSLIMGGVLPRLKTGALPGSEYWHYVSKVLPGPHPFESLAVSLVRSQTYPSSIRDLWHDLQAEKTQLGLLVKQMSENSGRRVVIFIDQLEEVFYLAAEQERRDFVESIATAVLEQADHILLIVTLQADLLERFQSYPTFKDLLYENIQTLQPMHWRGLREAIRKPAELTKLEFENDLDLELLIQANQQPNGLRLLQYLLDELYHRGEGRRFSEQDYLAIGGFQGAVGQIAEATYQSLPDDVRSGARDLFLRLLQVEEVEQTFHQRRIALEELAIPDPAVTAYFNRVVTAFAERGILSRNVAGNIPVVELNYPTIIDYWDRLRGWAEEARDVISFAQKFRSDVAEWVRRGKPSDALYRGLQLGEAEQWAENYALNIAESDFFTASQLWASAKRIFISYRRADSADVCKQLYQRLALHFGQEAIFMDVDDIPPGADFRAHIDAILARCAIVLVVIGPDWIHVAGENGKRRLDDPDDLVRIEVEKALAYDTIVIPLLVKGASFPKALDLPSSLLPLTNLNGARLRSAGLNPLRDRFSIDIQRLVQKVDEHISSR